MSSAITLAARFSASSRARTFEYTDEKRSKPARAKLVPWKITFLLLTSSSRNDASTA